MMRNRYVKECIHNFRIQYFDGVVKEEINFPYAPQPVALDIFKAVCCMSDSVTLFRNGVQFRTETD